MKKSLTVIAGLVTIIPVVYILIIYPSLPNTVPTHFDIEGKPNDWSSKGSFLGFTIGFSVFSFLLYLLLTNIYKIDPKKNAVENKGRLQKIAFAVVVFMSAIQTWIIYSTNKGFSGKEPKVIFIGVGLLFAIIGNYMENIRPNYFAGLRLPWTLENEDNWRKTHHYASRIWFWGGLIIAFFSLVLPLTLSIILLFSFTIIMVLLPVVYSYRLYKKNKQNFVS